MIRVRFVTWILFVSFSISAHNLIFVHLGDAVPPCIFTTMKQARTLNQDCDIYLLTDKRAHLFFQSDCHEFLAAERVSLVDMDLIPTTKEHDHFRRINKIDPSLSDGFWLYTSERFFTLFDFIADQNLENIVHLESDSMLYVDLDELYPLIKQLNIRLAAPFQSLKGCIPCFVFIKDSESLSFLIHHILSEMGDYKGTKPHIGINDMATLASFYRKWGVDYLMPLPTLMREYGQYYPKRKSHFGPDNATPLSFLSMYASSFPEYIFDAATLGIFINGNDRKYCPQHGPGTIHVRSLFDPRFFSFFWGEDAKGKNVPYLSFKGKNYRIANMHFHSKMPEEYTSFRETREELNP